MSRSRSTRFPTLLGRGATLLLLPLWATSVSGQAAAPPATATPTTPAPTPPSPPPGAGLVAGNLTVLVQQMGDRVRQLGEGIATDLAKTAAGPTLLQDARELAQAVDEYRTALTDEVDTLQRRQLYSGLESSWQQLQAQLKQPGASTRASTRWPGTSRRSTPRFTRRWG